MLRMTKILNKAEKELARKFSALNREYVSITNASTRGSVLFSTLAEDSSKSIQDILELNGNVALEEAYKNKYREKLVEAAVRKGYESLEAMLADQKKERSIVTKNVEVKLDQGLKQSNLPSNNKKLDEILKIDLIKNESAEKIVEIWNIYHSMKQYCLSASVDSSFYKDLLSKSKNYPLFVLPLPRDDGFEIFLLQWQGQQVFFTQLLEYQMNKENARPAFTVSFYNDLADEKGIVLMLGELSNGNGSVSLKDAQNLVYQLQIFYVTGNELQKGMLEKFWKQPDSFNHEELISSLQHLS